MIKTKFVKALMLGVCLSALSAGMAFAETAPDKGAEVTVQDSAADSGLTDLQSKIDQYVFKDHFDEIQKLGFSVIYTGQVNNYIEIGITPCSEENAAYLYDIFGKDQVKVVEGEPAELYTTMEGKEPELMATSGLAADDAVTDTQAEGTRDAAKGNIDVVKAAANAPAEEGASDKTDSILPAAGIAGVALLLGGAVMVSQKKKISK